MKILILGLLGVLLLPAYADVAVNLQIRDAFARSALQQQRNSAAFMRIHNPAQDAYITYAQSPAAKIVELHTHINDNGVMRMRRIKQIELPAGEIVELKPGGLHVMLLGLTRDLRVGDDIGLTLGFSDGSERELEVPVRRVMMRHNKGNMGQNSMSDDMPMMPH